MPSEAAARAKLLDLTAANTFPKLEEETIDRLLREARRPDRNGWLQHYDTEWQPNVVYAVDKVIVPRSRLEYLAPYTADYYGQGRAYRVTVGGNSGAVEPVWPTNVGDEVTVNGVTYRDISGLVSSWAPTHDLNKAAAEGWRIKAGLVSNRHSFGSNAGNYNPEQIHQHCLEMAALYAAKTVGAIVLESGRWDGRGRLPSAHYDDAV